MVFPLKCWCFYSFTILKNDIRPHSISFRDPKFKPRHLLSPGKAKAANRLPEHEEDTPLGHQVFSVDVLSRGKSRG